MMMVPGFDEAKTPALSQYTEWTASSIHLVRSYLDGGRPSRYEDVAEWPLAASPAPSGPATKSSAT